MLRENVFFSPMLQFLPQINLWVSLEEFYECYRNLIVDDEFRAICTLCHKTFNIKNLIKLIERIIKPGKEPVEIPITKEDIQRLEKEKEIAIAFNKKTLNPIYLKLE